jgi:hypothetical protein
MRNQLKKGTMKTAKKTLLVLGPVVALSLTNSLAQVNPNETWTIDENGPALISGGPVVGYINGQYLVDPVSGMMGWYYPLGLTGITLAAGDLVLDEPQAPTGTRSDLLRFDLNGVFFFSDLEAGEVNPDHADVAQIPPAAPNAIHILENGPEGSNGVFWVPAPGQPGSDTSGYYPGIQYNFISDTVPEPGVGILALAAILLKVVTRRRSS